MYREKNFKANQREKRLLPIRKDKLLSHRERCKKKMGSYFETAERQ